MEHATQDVVVTAPCGTLIGRRAGEAVQFRGIRYGRAERFASPVPERDATEPVDCRNPGPFAPQLPVPFLDEAFGPATHGLRQDEDCLRVAVTAPAVPRAEGPLPVLVWIHGGSYTSGTGDGPGYEPTSLVTEGDLVVVSVTYRLGLLGYLGDGGERAANLGLMDQLLALRWVRRNIEAFGGDPERVTAVGQSAGADAVLHLAVAGAGEGLFGRAIVQSPPLGIRPARAAMAQAMAEATAHVSRDSSLEEVLAAQADAERVARAFRLPSAMPFSVQYSHPPLPAEEDMEAAWDAVAQDIDLFIGRTTEEALLFLPRLEPVAKVTSLPVVGGRARRVLDEVATHVVYGRGIDALARRWVQAGGTCRSYRLSWSVPGNAYGACHAIELPLLFGDERVWRHAAVLRGARWSDVDAAGRRLRALWAAIAWGRPFDELPQEPGVLTHAAPRPLAPRRLRRSGS